MSQDFPLEGLFRYLVRAGFKLSIRDYQDALKALRAGYGIGTRDKLKWLCQTLWARSNEELRQLDQLFLSFPFPSAEQVEKLAAENDKTSEPERPGSSPASMLPRKKDRTEPVADDKPAIALEFGPPSQQGIALTSANAKPQPDELFILNERPMVSLRSLIIIWRRFRTAKREGPAVELDLEATIQEQSRHGRLPQPVLVPARRNQARLVILIDVSNSMLPWAGFQKLMVQSLRKGHFGRAAVYYFHNTPLEVLYKKETLTKPVPIERVLQENQGSTLMIYSDAGAARGFMRRDRIEESREFLGRVRREWQPIVWMNPMPRLRWRYSSADGISHLSHHTMLQLTEEGLIRAIDVLRGKQGY